MKNTQSLSDQQLNTSFVQQQANQSYSKLLIAFVFSSLLTGVITGSAVYFWQKSASEKAISSLEQKIAFLEKQASTDKSVPTTAPTTDWKTYRNTTYKFSFDYPSILKVVSNSDSVIDLVEQNTEKKNITPSDIKVRISVDQTSRNFNKIYSALNNTVISEEQHALSATFTKVKNRMVDGYKAVDYTYNVPGNQTSKSYTRGTIINKNGTLIEISISDSKLIDIDQILSTFEFTN